MMVSQMEPQLRQPRPLPSVIQGQALTSFGSGNSADPVAMMENLHMPPRATPSPATPAADFDGGMLNRPKPKPKSSAYRASPSRSPVPPSEGFQPPSYSEARSVPNGDRSGNFGDVSLERIMAEENVQQALLPHLPIASFLALMTALEKETRHAISGELVGRWVTSSWGMELAPGDVLQWPGLGVWEGFRGSLFQFMRKVEQKLIFSLCAISGIATS